ncbi:hypothetical protein BEWA_005340 [Theileria equi strain WA]|uniref:Doublecortin domain-containing protein n=1 Tax=Theileria equi strain WA TaxID=1537102 RepID=L0B1J6_THEEQ|nr:hypothetical protein BEWA_005340 [Theileria equi strain WA]AFZ81126.1 hypothetical protein BEWA_005340 [Theileria equi strain WA]|eukprot:XP_004830792.1 hypothetical protein BEWA_005340 [Theileria equi strain WA]
MAQTRNFVDYVERECNFVQNPFLVYSEEVDLVERNDPQSVGRKATDRRLHKSVNYKEDITNELREFKAKNPTQHTIFVQNKKYHLGERSVFERLTDPKYYTGIHRQRFDENGNGRGLAGRENIYLFDGNTESYSRVHEVYSSVLRKPKTTLTPGILGTQKFGVQIATPKLMWIYRNGDKFHNGIPFYVRPFIKNMDTLFYEISKELTLIAGPIRRIYDQNLKRIRDINEIIDGAKYLCTSGEPPTSKDRLEKFMSEWVIQRIYS